MADLEASLTPSDDDPSLLGVVGRPPFQLRSLPFRYRWEVTRRHPYYQGFWRSARAHHKNESIQHPAEPLFRQAAVIILGSIGVSGGPPDPSEEFEQLQADKLNLAWLSGAIHPITLRGLASLLITALPKETLAHVGLNLVQAGCDDEKDKPSRRSTALLNLTTLDKPGLDDYFDEPIVSINPAASARQITGAAATLLKEWKQDRDLGEQRDRSDKYPEYLEAWDLREGWAGSSYDVTQEHKLKEIASKLNVSLGTASHHYCSAFELIVGHSYSPELWYRVVGPLKLSGLTKSDCGQVSQRRPLKSRTPRPVPDSVLRGNIKNDDDGDRHQGVVEMEAFVGGDQDTVELIMDIRELLSRGHSDEQIVDRLELSLDRIGWVGYIRKRGEEPLWSLAESDVQK